MPLLITTEALRVCDSFLVSLYGDDIFRKWKDLKDEMKFMTEREYVSWLIDVAHSYRIDQPALRIDQHDLQQELNREPLFTDIGKLKVAKCRTRKRNRQLYPTTKNEYSPRVVNSNVNNQREDAIKTIKEEAVADLSQEALGIGNKVSHDIEEGVCRNEISPLCSPSNQTIDTFTEKQTFDVVDNYDEFNGKLEFVSADYVESDACSLQQQQQQHVVELMSGDEEQTAVVAAGAAAVYCEDAAAEGVLLSDDDTAVEPLDDDALSPLAADGDDSVLVSTESSGGRGGGGAGSGKKFTCPYCDFGTNYWASVKRHISTVHEKHRQHACQYCAYTSGLKFHLTSHLISKHGYRSNYQCAACGKYFRDQAYLQRHHTTCVQGLPALPAVPAALMQPHQSPTTSATTATADTQ